MKPLREFSLGGYFCGMGDIEMNVLLVEPGKAPRAVELENTLEAMQHAVGGLIQAVYPFEEPVALICNDEGKLLGLPLNRALSFSENGNCYDVIAGTFFLCCAPAGGDHFEGLSEEQLERYLDYFRTPELFLRVGNGLCVLPMVESDD